MGSDEIEGFAEIREL